MQCYVVGCVTTSFDMPLKLLRNKVDETIKESGNSRFLSTYEFIHSFDYTIYRHNEGDIVVLDIARSNSIFIRFASRRYDHASIVPMKSSSNDDISIGSGMEDQVDLVRSKSNASKKLTRYCLSNDKRNTDCFFSNRKKLKSQKLKSNQKNLIMISYVRQEASDHAVRLKNNLTLSGYSVYLVKHDD